MRFPSSFLPSAYLHAPASHPPLPSFLIPDLRFQALWLALEEWKT